MNDQSLKPADPSARTAAKPPPPPSASTTGRRPKRLLVPLVTLTLFAVAVAVWAGRWYLHSLAYVDEANARVVSEITALSSRVSGWVVEMRISEGSRVGRDEVLVQIDDRRSRMQRDELTLAHAALMAERDRVTAEISMVDGRTESRHASEKSKLAAAKALAESVQHELRYAEDEYKRAQSLSKRGVVAARALDQARTAYLRAQQERLRAQAQVASAKAELAEAASARRELDVLKAERAHLVHRAEAIQVQIERQALDVRDRAVRSPLDGVVSRTFVANGEYVTPGQRIALLHNPQEIWIEALIKETVVRRIAVGQPVEITIDAYPDQSFAGKVERIGHAATSEFTLLPTPNPSGTFTKVTQRIPIRVTLAQQNDLLKPGMMVEVSIDVREP
ncbi:MAG: HlyD family secretion protein [Alphaproteobacteria bacterium]|nr:HlyD family secretion protein [Alphaproteobacteria bacterium]